MRALVQSLRGRRRAPQNVGEGLQALGDGLVAGVTNWRANRAENARTEAGNSAYSSAMQRIVDAWGGKGKSASGAGVSTSGDVSNLSGNEISTAFIDTVRSGGISNPYALAAIAATGKAESGFSPENANRTWSDPSESGKAGTAGGILSWRAERLNNLSNYAASKGETLKTMSPQTQGEFFLQENPQLIAQLNGAKSLEEAMTFMNNAWQFAGYNRPGGEAARRLGYAQSFLPNFEGDGQPVQVASTGPVAMPAENPQPMNAAVSSNSANPELMAALLRKRSGEQPVAPGGAQQAIVNALQPQTAQAQSVTAPPQVAQAGTDDSLLLQIMQDMNNPNLSDWQRKSLEFAFQRELQRQDPVRRMQLEKTRLELDRLKNPQVPDSVRALDERAKRAGLQPGTPGYAEFMTTSGGKGVSVNVNTGSNSSEFAKESDKKAAERLGTIVEEGRSAAGMMADMQTLADLGTQIETGLGAQALVALGPYAQALGINTEGLGPAQAYGAIISRLAPQMRPAGSGATSDFDARQFLNSLPSLGKTPEGNAIINQTFQAVAQNKMDAAQIASRAQLGEISWQQAETEISKLPNPYEIFKRRNDQGQKATPGSDEAAPVLSDTDKAQALEKARAAIAAGKDRSAVIQRLQHYGIDPSGL